MLNYILYFLYIGYYSPRLIIFGVAAKNVPLWMTHNSSGYISLAKGKLHYLRFGSGKRLLLAFHGYGNTASIFQPFRQYVETDFTVISIDLPHHGKSKWEEGLQLHKHDLEELINYCINTFGVNKLSLLGYSMGGRVCLTITDLVPEKVEQVLLIASDGLVFNPFYFFVTKTYIGKRIFRKFLTNTSRYAGIVNWMRKKQWIDQSRYKFAMYYLGSEADRQFLLKVWPGMSLITPNRRHLRSVINTYRIPVYIFMGAYDRIIPVPHAQRFKKDLETVQLFILEKGHRVLDADTLPQMASCLINGTC